MEKSAKKSQPKKHYWAIIRRGEVVYGGTFSQCWNELVSRFANYTMAGLEKNGIRIGRTS